MTGIHQVVLVTEAPDVVANYSATMTVGYNLFNGHYEYGYVADIGDPVGSISSESGGTMAYCVSDSTSADFSNPTTSMSIAGLNGLTTANVTIGGISRSDGYTSSGSDGTWSWPGDVFALRSRNGQSLAVTVQGAA
jgi:hypothetical protein